MKQLEEILAELGITEHTEVLSNYRNDLILSHSKALQDLTIVKDQEKADAIADLLQKKEKDMNDLSLSKDLIHEEKMAELGNIIGEKNNIISQQENAILIKSNTISNKDNIISELENNITALTSEKENAIASYNELLEYKSQILAKVIKCEGDIEKLTALAEEVGKDAKQVERERLLAIKAKAEEELQALQ